MYICIYPQDTKPALPIVDPRFSIQPDQFVNPPPLIAHPLQAQPGSLPVGPQNNTNDQGNGSFKDWDIIEDASEIPVSDPVLPVSVYTQSVSSVSTVSSSMDQDDQISLLAKAAQTESERDNIAQTESQQSGYAPQVVSGAYPPPCSQPQTQGHPPQNPPAAQQTQGLPLQVPLPVQSIQQTQVLPPHDSPAVQAGLPLQVPPVVQSLQQTQGLPPQAPPAAQQLHQTQGHPLQALQQTQELSPQAPPAAQPLQQTYGLSPQAPLPVQSLQHIQGLPPQASLSVQPLQQTQELPPQAPPPVQSLQQTQGLPPQGPPSVQSCQQSQGLPPQVLTSVQSLQRLSLDDLPPVQSLQGHPPPEIPTLAPPTNQVSTQVQSQPQTNEVTTVQSSKVNYLPNPVHPAASDPLIQVTLATAPPPQHPHPVTSTSSSAQQSTTVAGSQPHLPASAPLVVLPPVSLSVQPSSNREQVLSTPASTMTTVLPPATEGIQQAVTVHNPAAPPISTSSDVGEASLPPASGTQTHTPQPQATTVASVETTVHPPPPHTTHPQPSHTHTTHSENIVHPAETHTGHAYDKTYPHRPQYPDEDYRHHTRYYHDDHYRYHRDDPYHDPRDRRRHPSGHHHPSSHDLSHDPSYRYPPHPPSQYSHNQYRHPYDDPHYRHRGYDQVPYENRYRGDRYHRPHPDERYTRPHSRDPYDPYDPHYDQRSEYEDQYYRTDGYGNEYSSRAGYGSHDYYQRRYDHRPDPHADYGYPEQDGYGGHQREDISYESEQYSQQYAGHEVTHQGELDPAETSAIPGHMDNYEVGGTFIDSPQARPSQWPQQTQHDPTAYFDPSSALSYGEQSGVQYTQAEIQPQGDYQYAHDDYSNERYEANDYQSGYPEYTDGGYAQSQVYGETENQQYNYNNQSYDVAQQWEAIQPTPPPQRQTPELFVHPHVRASFGFGGQLVTVLPNSAMRKQPLTVEISEVKYLVEGTDSLSFAESVDSFPGPFMPGSTPKNLVVQYANREAQKVRDRVKVLSESAGNSLEVKQLKDEVLLWEFLVLLCQQNGVILPTDISDLLMKDHTLSVNSSLHLGSADREEALGTLRSLLLAGQRKDALDLACSKSLWGHALMLASNMDESSRNYVVNRFTASLMSTDPLGTFYTLLLGRVPSAVKIDGLQRAGDWRPHLAMILANRMSKLDNSSVISLGEALHNQGRLNAAHLCYFLGNVHFGGYGDQDSKYSLLGVDQCKLQVGTYPHPEILRKMEVFEYAMSLSKQEFSLPSFQTFKFLHVLKLLEAGYVDKALKYCEQMCLSVVKGPKHYTPVLLNSLVDVSVRLHHLNSPFGIIENEHPAWLSHVEKCVRVTVSSDYTPHLFSPSPAFSSVSQTYAGNQQVAQPMAGLQGFLTVPPSGGSVKGGSELSSKEGSVVNMQIALQPSSTQTSDVHQLEMFATSQTVAEQQHHQVDQLQTFNSNQPVEPSQYNQLQGQPSTSTVVSENPVEGQEMNPAQDNLAFSYPPQQAGTLLGGEGIDGGNVYQQQHMYYGLQAPGQQQEVGVVSSQGQPFEQVQSGIGQINVGVGGMGDIPQADHVTGECVVCFADHVTGLVDCRVTDYCVALH